jgi:hypothetical protein
MANCGAPVGAIVGDRGAAGRWARPAAWLPAVTVGALGSVVACGTASGAVGDDGGAIGSTGGVTAPTPARTASSAGCRNAACAICCGVMGAAGGAAAASRACPWIGLPLPWCGHLEARVEVQATPAEEEIADPSEPPALVTMGRSDPQRRHAPRCARGGEPWPALPRPGRAWVPARARRHRLPRTTQRPSRSRGGRLRAAASAARGTP